MQSLADIKKSSLAISEHSPNPETLLGPGHGLLGVLEVPRYQTLSPCRLMAIGSATGFLCRYWTLAWMMGAPPVVSN